MKMSTFQSLLLAYNMEDLSLDPPLTTLLCQTRLEPLHLISIQIIREISGQICTWYLYMNKEISLQKEASAGEPISDSKPRKWKSQTSQIWIPKVNTAEQSNVSTSLFCVFCKIFSDDFSNEPTRNGSNLCMTLLDEDLISGLTLNISGLRTDFCRFFQDS